MSRAERFRDQRGVTLIETVVALGLFAMAAATTATFLVAQVRYASDNNLQTKAYSLAEEELEYLRSERFNDMAGGSKLVTVGAVKYNIVDTVTDDTPANGLKTIKINVGWNDQAGARNVQVQTVYTEVRAF